MSRTDAAEPRSRPLSVADADTMAALINDQHRALTGHDAVSPAEMRTWLSMPEGNLERDSRMLHDADGRPFGTVVVESRGEHTVNAFVSLRSGSADERTRLAEYLLDEVEARAADCARGGRLSDAVLEVQEIPRGDTEVEDALRRRGYTLARQMVELARDLHDLPAPRWPVGVHVVGVDVGTPAHIDALASLEAEAFADHDGELTLSRSQLEHLLRSDPQYLAPLQLLVVPDGWNGSPDDTVGFCLASEFVGSDHPSGYISSLGVRRIWRGLGIGRALLLTEFAAFAVLGWTQAHLHVQLGNRTGADRLYASVGMSERSGLAAWAGPASLAPRLRA
jgi:ribosomal protein S18 acetylase RimI-like enzyme